MQPEEKAATRRFLGTRKFCPRLSRVVHPLQDLTHLKQQFIWADQHTKAFQEAKHLVFTAPCVRYFDMNSPVVCKSMLRAMVLVLFFSNQASVARSHQKLSGNLLHTALVLSRQQKRDTHKLRKRPWL